MESCCFHRYAHEYLERMADTDSVQYFVSLYLTAAYGELQAILSWEPKNAL